MAITEPHPPHDPAQNAGEPHQDAGEPHQDAGEPPSADPPVQRRRHPWRRRSLITLGALLAAAVTVLGVLAGTYQPLDFGGQWGGSFPGLPAGTGLRSVNTFAEQTGETYVPPQAGVFTVVESIYNNGPKPVTIEAVSILSPKTQATLTDGESPWPVVPAGPVRWTFQIHYPHQVGIDSGRSVAGVTLPPGQGLELGIPLRLASGGLCYVTGSWVTIDVFYVKERFGPFTHWVTIQFPQPVITHAPPVSGQTNDLTCPPGVKP